MCVVKIKKTSNKTNFKKTIKPQKHAFCSNITLKSTIKIPINGDFFCLFNFRTCITKFNKMYTFSVPKIYNAYLNW